MKQFTRIDPTTRQDVGVRYKRTVVIKNYQTEDGLTHQFTTFGSEGSRGGAVIALTPDLQVVTVHQFRAGPERWVYDLPGGGLRSGEDPEAGALRELAEETGYVPGRVEFLGTSHGDAYTNFQRYYYLVTDCVPGETKLDREESEQGAEVRLISITDLIANAKQDNMTDPVAILLAYDRLKSLES